MKRMTVLALTLAFGFASALAFVGCSEEAKVKETVSTPTGTTTTEKKIESSGSNPPANSEGEKVK
jgi:hypothetical protein